MSPWVVAGPATATATVTVWMWPVVEPTGADSRTGAVGPGKGCLTHSTSLAHTPMHVVGVTWTRLQWAADHRSAHRRVS